MTIPLTDTGNRMNSTTEDKLGTMLNKVPEVTLIFWILKILATTVGETAGDLLSITLGLGTVNTSFVMGAILLVCLYFQLRAKKYEPPIYWLVVVFISVVGTLISDNLVDNLGVSLVTTTVIFTIALALVFIFWYRTERTLSVHTIYTRRRELFYWAAILFTFSLGTSGGDLLAERMGVGYALSAAIFGGAIAIIYALYRFGVMNEVLAFWLAYILTRPLGASLGDLLTQARDEGGLGLGTVPVSAVFLLLIVILVAYLTREEKRAGPPKRFVADRNE
jgi:uncharacterized membrane-anchored protein